MIVSSPLPRVLSSAIGRHEMGSVLWPLPCSSRAIVTDFQNTMVAYEEAGVVHPDQVLHQDVECCQDNFVRDFVWAGRFVVRHSAEGFPGFLIGE